MSQSKYPLSWFLSREGQTIKRNGRSFKITNKEKANYCFELQEEGVTFSEAARPKVHISSNACTSCEG